MDPADDAALPERKSSLGRSSSSTPLIGPDSGQFQHSPLRGAPPAPSAAAPVSPLRRELVTDAPHGGAPPAVTVPAQAFAAPATLATAGSPGHRASSPSSHNGVSSAETLSAYDSDASLRETAVPVKQAFAAGTAGGAVLGGIVSSPSTRALEGAGPPSKGAASGSPGRRRWRFWAMGVAAVTVVGVAVGVGLGLTLGKDRGVSTGGVSQVDASSLSSTTLLYTPTTTVAVTTTTTTSTTTTAAALPLKPLYPIRGVNIGGWIVIEPFLNPSLYVLANGTRVRDNWVLCSTLGQAGCTTLLERHYDTFITEDDFKQISDAGLNLVRIPINYWALNADPTEPYPVNVGWKYVDRALGWARKYGINVKFDLHCAPGNQNPWGLSGREGFFDWQTNSQNYFDRTTATLAELVNRIAGPDYAHVKFIELLNEPTLILMDQANQDKIYGFYRQVLATLRNITADSTRYPGGGPMFGVNDGFQFGGFAGGQTPQAAGFGSIFMDFHYYAIYTEKELQYTRSQLLDYACSSWGGGTRAFNSTKAPLIVGEFSSAYTDCAQYINGNYEGYRSDGTISSGGFTNTCNCSCNTPAQRDYRTFTPERIARLREFTEVQMDSAEKNGMGWVFWTWKTESVGGVPVAPDFNYQLGLQAGWIPQDPSPAGRTTACP